MKKLVALTLLIMFATAGSVCAAAWTSTVTKTLYAAKGTTAPSTAAEGALIGKLSTNVLAGGWCETTGYSIGTFHTSGSQAYGTAHDSTSIYMKKDDALDAFTKTGTGDFAAGGWTQL